MELQKGKVSRGYKKYTPRNTQYSWGGISAECYNYCTYSISVSRPWQRSRVISSYYWAECCSGPVPCFDSEGWGCPCSSCGSLSQCRSGGGGVSGFTGWHCSAGAPACKRLDPLPAARFTSRLIKCKSRGFGRGGDSRVNIFMQVVNCKCWKWAHVLENVVLWL